MNSINKIVDQIIIEANFDVGALEREFNRIKKKLGNKNIGSLNTQELRTILAFEYLKDGAEIDYVKQILKSKDSKQQLISHLIIFGY